MMLSRPRPVVLAIAALSAALALPGMMSSAFAEPPRISPLTSVTSNWNEQQRATVREYVEYWGGELASKDADRAKLARRRLTEDLNAPGVRQLFRDEYGRVAVPVLDRLVASEETFAAVNAIIVIGEIGTDASLAVIRERIDPQREPREAVRLNAVIGLRSIQRVNLASQRTLELTQRDLVRAAERETSWLVLRRSFEALDAAGTQHTRDLQVELLRTVLDKIESDESAAPLIQAVHRGVFLMRDSFIAIPNATEQRAFGTTAAPQLGRVLEISGSKWESARSSEPHIRAAFDSTVQLSEQLLRFIDERVRNQQPPRDLLHAAWTSGNRNAYQDRLRHWQGVLASPTYVRR